MSLFMNSIDSGAYSTPLFYLPIYNQIGILCICVTSQTTGAPLASGIYNTSSFTNNMNQIISRNVYITSSWAGCKGLNTLDVEADYYYLGIRLNPYFSEAVTITVTYIGNGVPQTLTDTSTDPGSW